MPLGGAISRPLTDATAFYYRHASVWLIIMTKYVKDSSSNNKESPSLVQKKLDGIQWVKGLIGELKPWICGVYQALGEVEGVDAGDICETGVAVSSGEGERSSKRV